MWRRFQFGFEHWAGSIAAAPIVLFGNPRVQVSSGTLRSLRAEGFATAELVAMATAIAISIAVASGALTAGETLRALRFLCPNAPRFTGALPGFAGACWLTLFMVPLSSFLTAANGACSLGLRLRSKPLRKEPAGALWLERLTPGRVATALPYRSFSNAAFVEAKQQA